MSYPLVNLTNLVQAAHFILSLNYVTSESSHSAIINWQQYYTRLQASFADWLISKSNLRLGTLDVIETVEYCLQTLLDTVNIMVPQFYPKTDTN